MQTLEITSINERNHFTATKYSFIDVKKAISCVDKEWIVRTHELLDYHNYLEFKQLINTQTTLRGLYDLLNSAPTCFNKYLIILLRSKEETKWQKN